MAPAGVDATQEARLMRALLKEPDVAALRDARVALAIDDGVRREAAKAARLIVDAAAVERARAHFAEAGATDAADMLDAYLDLRRAGGWTPPHEAPNLAALVARAASNSTPRGSKPKASRRRRRLRSGRRDYLLRCAVYLDADGRGRAACGRSPGQSLENAVSALSSEPPKSSCLPARLQSRESDNRSLLKNVTLNWNIQPRNAWRKQR